MPATQRSAYAFPLSRLYCSWGSYPGAIDEGPMHSPVLPLLLDTDEVAPVREDNANSTSPFLLVCDHYGKRIPERLGRLGLTESDLERHIASDVGIAGVARRLAEATGAHLIAQRSSRPITRALRRRSTAAPRRSSRPFFYRCIRSRRSMRASRGPGMSARSTRTATACHPYCSSCCAPKAISWSATTNLMRCATPPTTPSPCMASGES